MHFFDIFIILKYLLEIDLDRSLNINLCDIRIIFEQVIPAASPVPGSCVAGTVVGEFYGVAVFDRPFDQAAAAFSACLSECLTADH